MATSCRHNLDELIELSASMPSIRYSVARGYTDWPVRCRIADEALLHAEAMRANRMLVVFPTHACVPVCYKGDAWIADSGDTLETIQYDLDLHLRSAIRARTMAATAAPRRTDRFAQIMHARCDVAELLQIQNVGRLLSAWADIRRQAGASAPYRIALANELRSERPAANLNRHLAQIVHTRIATIQAWPPPLAIKQTERHIDALRMANGHYERELHWKHIRLCAKCNPVYRARLAEALPDWRPTAQPSGMPQRHAPIRSDAAPPVSRTGMRP